MVVTVPRMDRRILRAENRSTKLTNYVNNFITPTNVYPQTTKNVHRLRFTNGKLKTTGNRLVVSSDLIVDQSIEIRHTVPTHNKHFSYNKRTLFVLTKMCLFGDKEDFRKINSVNLFDIESLKSTRNTRNIFSVIKFFRKFKNANANTRVYSVQTIVYT